MFGKGVLRDTDGQFIVFEKVELFSSIDGELEVFKFIFFSSTDELYSFFFSNLFYAVNDSGSKCRLILVHSSQYVPAVAWMAIQNIA